MRRRILFLTTIAIPLSLLGLVLMLLGSLRGGRGEALEARVPAAVEIIVDVPTLNPPYTSDCQDAWKRIPTNLGSYAYLTLNAHDAVYSTNSGTWKPTLPQDGFYRVEAYIPGHDPVAWCVSGRTIYSDTVDARYEIHHAGGITTKGVSQRALANQWLDLGSYPFKAGSGGYVFLDDLTSEANFTSTISYSAMRFTYLSSNTASYFPLISKSQPTATPSPGVQVINRAGFDACTLPAISKMQTWWNASPYWIYGLYLGGISYPDPPACSRAEAAWVAAVRQQGWTFIPTWVGPQAPCSTYKHKMSSDPATAYQQGRSEAEAAFTAAASVGLISPGHGTVIYYDLEIFGGASLDCRLTAKTFINGWTERLHELGQRAGAYGAGCSSYIQDWATLTHVPDDIWAASWYQPFEYDPSASVFGVLCLPDNLWANHQRIRQYAGDHNETWGGQTHNIDSDIADGEVAVPGVAGAAASSSAAATRQPVIQDMGWFSGERGWLLTSGRLIWTEDGGVTWTDKTPPGARLAAASFINEGEGWAAASLARQGEYLAYHTTDGGSTWQVQSLPLPAGDWQPLQITFSDSSNGWATYRLMTSALFSQGELLKTADGGKTWAALALPIGEPVYFTSPLSGWTMGGAAGNEWFTTTDGGMTWQAQNPKTTTLPAGNPNDSGKQLTTNLPGEVERSVFPSAQTGWAFTVQGVCSGEKTSPDFSCAQISTLWKTVDGGADWQSVGLPSYGK